MRGITPVNKPNPSRDLHATSFRERKSEPLVQVNACPQLSLGGINAVVSHGGTRRRRAGLGSHVQRPGGSDSTDRERSRSNRFSPWLTTTAIAAITLIIATVITIVAAGDTTVTAIAAGGEVKLRFARWAQQARVPYRLLYLGIGRAPFPYTRRLPTYAGADLAARFSFACVNQL